MSQEPSWIFSRELHDDEATLFGKWTARCHEVAESEGQALDILGDAVPILIALMFQEHPDWNTAKRIDATMRFCEALRTAIELHAKRAEGEA